MDIKAFLQPPVMEETKQVMISERFKGPDGKPAPFTIRVIDAETNSRLQRQATKRVKENGMTRQELDADRYGKLLVSACVVEPDFRNTEICNFYKTVDPLEVPGRMLSMGEYNRLVEEIRNLNGVVSSASELEEIREEAKN